MGNTDVSVFSSPYIFNTEKSGIMLLARIKCIHNSATQLLLPISGLFQTCSHKLKTFIYQISSIFTQAQQKKNLPHISEMNVLIIRQILEICILVHSLSSSAIKTISTLVLISAVCHVHADGNHSEDIGGENGTHTKCVERCLLRLKELGCDDVG